MFVNGQVSCMSALRSGASNLRLSGRMMTLDHFILPAWASSTPIDMDLLSAKPYRLYPLVLPTHQLPDALCDLGSHQDTCRSSPPMPSSPAGWIRNGAAGSWPPWDRRAGYGGYWNTLLLLERPGRLVAVRLGLPSFFFLPAYQEAMILAVSS